MKLQEIRIIVGMSKNPTKKVPQAGLFHNTDTIKASF